MYSDPFLPVMGVLDHIKTARQNKLPVKSSANAVLRDANGRLLPGRTLNPGGRPKGVEAVLKGILERGNAELTIEQVISGELPADIRLRVETIRWAHERAFGKALDRAHNVTVTLPGEPVPLDMAGYSHADVDALQMLIRKGTPQLPGDVVEGEFSTEDLPLTDQSNAPNTKAQK